MQFKFLPRVCYIPQYYEKWGRGMRAHKQYDYLKIFKWAEFSKIIFQILIEKVIKYIERRKFLRGFKSVWLNPNEWKEEKGNEPQNQERF